MLTVTMKAGDVISGKYRLTQRLGVGAMGAVWESINQRTGRRVALKLILHPTDDLRLRLLREARACGSLEHRNIVEIYDVGETEGGDPFLVMQLLSGETLAGLLSRKRRIDPPLAARIARDIAGALAVAHEAKIIHRDLKPANIFLHREGDVGETEFVLKVLDFGVSKNLASVDGPATVTGMVIGSPAYMSPEQIRMLKDLDCRSDIWSLGIILFEMLTGVRLFRGTAQEMMTQVLAAPIPPVSSRVRHVPQELDAIVARCLERDRDRRFQDAKEIARVLSALAEDSQRSRGLDHGPTASAQGAGRPAMGSAPSERPASAVVDRVDQEATLLFQRRATLVHRDPQWSATEAGGGEKWPPASAPAATQLLSPGDPIPSPTPPWRLEMQQALAASRQPATTPGDAPSEDFPQGGTVALSPLVVAPTTPAAERDARPTKAAPSERPAVQGKLPEALKGEGTVRAHPRRGKAWLYAVAGVGVVTLAAPVAVLGVGGFSPERASELATSQEEAPRRVSGPESVSPTAPMATLAPSIAPTVSAGPTAHAARSSPALVRPVPPANSTKPRQGSTFGSPSSRPKCGKFIKTNCDR